MDEILPALEEVYTSKLKYKYNLKTDVIDSNLGTLVGKVEHHIIICGYKEGVNYYIE
jgi:myo-inositol-1-phosphate synthase